MRLYTEGTGNFKKLMSWIQKGYPMPFGNINNKRSFVSIYNLCHLIETCLNNENAANQCFLVSDDHDLSTTELIELLGSSMKKMQSCFHFQIVS